MPTFPTPHLVSISAVTLPTPPIPTTATVYSRIFWGENDIHKSEEAKWTNYKHVKVDRAWLWLKSNLFHSSIRLSSWKINILLKYISQRSPFSILLIGIIEKIFFSFLGIIRLWTEKLHTKSCKIVGKVWPCFLFREIKQ